MAEERPPQVVYVGPDVAVWLGRTLAFVVISLALAIGSKVAYESREEQFWAFLATAITPLGIGFLVLVAAEILNRIAPKRL